MEMSDYQDYGWSDLERDLEELEELLLQDIAYAEHPCKKCKGFVPDGAIICIHCDKENP